VTHADPKLPLTYSEVRASIAPRQGFRQWLATKLARAAEADRRRRDMLKLLEMPDSVVRDIGLTRTDVIRMLRR
jgi:uncharacterized protein YjiS (DUF1127 family)